jgi:hypothetical protein
MNMQAVQNALRARKNEPVSVLGRQRKATETAGEASIRKVSPAVSVPNLNTILFKRQLS